MIFPTLYTARLTLRRLQVEDVPSLVRYANNRNISDHILNIPHPYGEPDAVFRISYVLQGFKSGQRYLFAIILNEHEGLIGEAGLHLHAGNGVAELGYWVAEPFWGRGYGSEAVAAVIAFGFAKLNLETIYATCHINNTGSEKLLLKNGMTKSGERANVMEYRISAPNSLAPN